jgi:hypothetical protein
MCRHPASIIIVDIDIDIDIDIDNGFIQYMSTPSLELSFIPVKLVNRTRYLIAFTRCRHQRANECEVLIDREHFHENTFRSISNNSRFLIGKDESVKALILDGLVSLV